MAQSSTIAPFICSGRAANLLSHVYQGTSSSIMVLHVTKVVQIMMNSWISRTSCHRVTISKAREGKMQLQMGAIKPLPPYMSTANDTSAQPWVSSTVSHHLTGEEVTLVFALHLFVSTLPVLELSLVQTAVFAECASSTASLLLLFLPSTKPEQFICDVLVAESTPRRGMCDDWDAPIVDNTGSDS